MKILFNNHRHEEQLPRLLRRETPRNDDQSANKFLKMRLPHNSKNPFKTQNMKLLYTDSKREAVGNALILRNLRGGVTQWAYSPRGATT